MERDQAKNRILRDCGEGWLDLVDEAYDNLPHGIEITSVYQKYASLRFDIEPDCNEFGEYLLEIESRSESICEVCGNSGSLCTKNSWERTLCNKHCGEWRIGRILI